MHACFACAPGPSAIYHPASGSSTARIPARFAGPPGLANGGIAAGALICPALRAASRAGASAAGATRVMARLQRGVSLARDIDVIVDDSHEGYGVTLSLDGSVLIAGSVSVAQGPAARLGDVIGTPPAERKDDLAALAAIHPPERPPFYIETGEHPLPGCFSCGPENEAGLHLYPRFVEDGVVCAPWKPSAEFDEGAGALAQAVIASALDCSSGICLPPQMQRELLEEDRFFLLGSLDVRYLRVAPVAATYRVAARMLARDGRKFFGFSALFDDAGVAFATAEATWIVAAVTRTEAFGART